MITFLEIELKKNEKLGDNKTFTNIISPLKDQLKNVKPPKN